MAKKSGSTYIDPHRKKRLRYPDCPPLLQDYIDSKLAENLAIRSVNTYYIDIRTFLRFVMVQHGMVSEELPFEDISIAELTEDDICSITKKDILDYKIFISSELANMPATQWHKITCVKSFFKYLFLNDIIKDNPAEKVPGVSMRNQSAKKPVYLEEDQAVSLVSAVSGHFEARDRCIMTLFLNCGMRLSELTGIDLDDILNDEALVLHGKGNKVRKVFLNAACQRTLSIYLEERKNMKNPENSNALFLSRNGRRISNRAVENLVKKYVLASGVSGEDGQRITPHKLRHTAATAYYRSCGADLMELAAQLGHAHTTTTEIYTHLDAEKQLKRMAEASPFANIDESSASTT